MSFSEVEVTVSLKPHSVYRVPEETARIAQAAFPEGNLYLRMYDTLGVIFNDADFASLFPTVGQPALSPARLALVTLLQFAEGLSDRQAADAVRARLDWKYVLGLQLTDPGFDHTVLSEFRSRLLEGSAEQWLLDKLLRTFRTQGWLKARGRQRTDSTHVLAAVRALHRIECVIETMRAALNALALVAPEWLQAQVPAHWVERYAKRADDFRLPKSLSAREALAEAVGADGYQLLEALFSTSAPSWLCNIPAVEVLRQVWIQQYLPVEGGVRWRQTGDLPPAAQLINSPYDPDAHYAKKRSTSWVGYKVHVTETCEEDHPHLITHVETAPPASGDHDALPAIHGALKDKGLVPESHLVDTGYVEAKGLVTSQDAYGIELIGPTRADYHWQAQAGEGFEAECFQIDWDHQQATCPAGQTSLSWTPATDRRDNEVIKIKFSRSDCHACTSQAKCTQTASGRRSLTLRSRQYALALKAARARERSQAFKDVYRQRAGIEGTLSEGVRCHGLRRSRYVGFRKTHLQHVLTAAAINVVRIGQWLGGSPRARTRISPFAALLAPAA